MNKNEFETVIDAEDKSFGGKLKEVVPYKDLVVTLVRRNFVSIYKQTVLGPLWIILSPLITSVVFTFVFGQLAGISTEGMPQFLFYLGGNALWTFFSSSFTGTSNTFTANAGIFGKVYFPRLVMPISTVITQLINFSIQFVLYILFFLYFFITGSPVKLTWAALYLPILLLQLGILAMSGGIIVSALTTKYRDLAIAVTFGVQLWMYISPIVYPLSSVKGLTRLVLLINPVSMPLEIFRIGFMGTGTVIWWSLALSWGITFLAVIIGVRLFGKVERTFIDTI